MNWVAPIKDEDVLKRYKEELLQLDTKYYIMFEIGVGTGMQVQDILKLKVGANDQTHLSFVVQKCGVPLRCRGQRRRAKVAGDPIVLGDSCQSGEIEVMQDICRLSRSIHAGRAVTILPFMTGQILRHGSFTSLRSNRTGFSLLPWSALRCRSRLPRHGARQ